MHRNGFGEAPAREVSFNHTLFPVLPIHPESAEYIRADLSPQWQPIETHDGCQLEVFVWMDISPRYGGFSPCIRKGKWLWELEEWQVEGLSGNVPPQPTHWMPPPKPPTE